MPYMMQSFVSFAMLIGFVYIFFIAVLGVVIYCILRFRDARGSLHDPQLGLKCAIHLLLTVAALSAVNGAGMILGDLMSRIVSDESMSFDPYSRRSAFNPGLSGFPSATMRIGFGMMLAGIVLALAEIWFLYSRTNDAKWPVARRMFTGVRVLVYGLTVTGLFIGAFSVAFVDFGVGRDETFKQQFLFTAMGNLAIWTSALALEMTLLLMFVKQGNTPGENYRCLDCGTDLRGKVTQTNFKCPQCGAQAPPTVRRQISSMEISAPIGKQIPPQQTPQIQTQQQQNPPVSPGG